MRTAGGRKPHSWKGNPLIAHIPSPGNINQSISDLNIPQISKLNIQQPATTQQATTQRQRSLRSTTNIPDSPMPAPIPTRQQASMPPPQMPQPGTWTPDAGIKFGIPMPLPQNSGQGHGPAGPKSGLWDPNQGIRFG